MLFLYIAVMIIVAAEINKILIIYYRNDDAETLRTRKTAKRKAGSVFMLTESVGRLQTTE